jgi:hypothetical protein
MIHGFLWLGGVVEHTAGAYRVIGEHMRSSLAVAA